MITNFDEALEQNKRLVDETFKLTQELEIKDSEIRELKTQLTNQRYEGGPQFSRNEDQSQSAMAALKNSEEMNLKLVRGHKEMDRKIKELESKFMETSQLLAVTQQKLKAKEIEAAGQQSKLAAYENKEGMIQIIDELDKQLEMKNSVIELMSEESKMREIFFKDSLTGIQSMTEERNIIFEQMQKLQKQFEYSNQEFHQAKLDNAMIAEIVFEHEKKETELKEEIRRLERELEMRKSQMQSQPALEALLGKMNEMNKEIERLSSQAQLMK